MLKKVMVDKTDFEVQHLVSRLFTAGFRSRLMPGDQDNYLYLLVKSKSGLAVIPEIWFFSRVGYWTSHLQTGGLIFMAVC
jgi:hypothetical protein